MPLASPLSPCNSAADGSLASTIDSYRRSIQQALEQGKIATRQARILVDVAAQLQQTLANFEADLAKKFPSPAD